MGGGGTSSNISLAAHADKLDIPNNSSENEAAFSLPLVVYLVKQISLTAHADKPSIPNKCSAARRSEAAQNLPIGPSPNVALDLALAAAASNLVREAGELRPDFSGVLHGCVRGDVRGLRDLNRLRARHSLRLELGEPAELDDALRERPS